MRAFVTGATGNVGAAAVRHLLAAGHDVRALVRRPGAELPAGAEAIVGDLRSPGDLASSLAGTEAVFAYATNTGLTALLAAAAGAGVRRAVLVSSGSVGASKWRNITVDDHERAEDEVRASGLGWTFLRPHEFMTNSLGWAAALRRSDTIVLPFAAVHRAVVDPDDIGAVAAASLADPAHENRVYRVTGPEPLTPTDQVRVLGEALGRDLRVEAQSDEDAHRAMSAQMPVAYVDSMFDIFVRGAYDEGEVHSGIPDALGRPARSYTEWVKHHLEAFA